MTDYVRKLVSGRKARFEDGDLDINLDLVYLTDQVIIMGYPASGVEGLYRNRREDAKKFLETRHGKNYWIYNFCPITENSYDASFFDGRVSRYPFPDHHAPPLALLPLIAREMRTWLSGSPERVAVLHCKAGKGRSGTMACAYLLSLNDDPTPPKLERSYTAKEWSKRRADDLMDQMPGDDDEASEQVQPVLGDQALTASPVQTSTSPASVPSKPKGQATLSAVLDLHTSRRMKAPTDGQKSKQGVSIPSQRRWLEYWSLLLSQEAPAHVWGGLSPLPASPEQIYHAPKVRLTDITLRMKESSGVKATLVSAANAVIDRAGMGKSGSREAKSAGDSHVWLSLARYDDDFVDRLESWEIHTRDEDGHLGRRKKGTEHNKDGEAITELFKDEKWDGGKMVKSFARMGAFDEDGVVKSEDKELGKITTYKFKPLNPSSWKNIRDSVQAKDSSKLGVPQASEAPSGASSIHADMYPAKEDGVVLDAAREVRVKIYMGQIFMGWFWFIPTFHMAQPPSAEHPKATLKLTRKGVDFPLGLGSGIIDLEVSLQWLDRNDRESPHPPARVTVEEEPTGVAAALQGADIRQAVEVNQAAAE
ncbi:hypothetical protein CYLTODRAFT_418520 [Cylindrobasidium torrendii FP15055 ss-10]|uniref:phosphatidylinositol-3,4,5-trisphosphate 3-phosphatase n=1 Tax=Cylindrobasidium torrendii FP15055 ss-10 TaxID=1314674 RepID=A0A0D7BQD4_9AGAR|nr:hypothetical protein CYLTODRAFT_418520 [Cylindrobasidium torrendii FP15055 ss-10]